MVFNHLVYSPEKANITYSWFLTYLCTLNNALMNKKKGHFMKCWNSEWVKRDVLIQVLNSKLLWTKLSFPDWHKDTHILFKKTANMFLKGQNQHVH